jgi:hypothetical protein
MHRPRFVLCLALILGLTGLLSLVRGVPSPRVEAAPSAGCDAAFTPIYTLQGAGPSSPFANHEKTTRG